MNSSFGKTAPEGFDAVAVAANLGAVVLGNVVGGVALVALVYGWIYRR